MLYLKKRVNMSTKLMKKAGMLFLLLLFFTIPSLSQVRTLTIDQAIETALQNNQEAEIARMEVKKAQAQVDEAYGYALPSLDVTASFSHFLEKPMMSFPDFEAMLTNATYGVLAKEDLITDEVRDANMMDGGNILQSFAQTNNYEAKAQLTQILFNSAVLRGISASGIYLQTSRIALSGKAAAIVTDVKKAFYAVLLTKEMLQITESSLKNFEDNLSNLSALKEHGLVSEYDLLTAEVQLENFRPRVLEAQNGLDNAKNGLKMIMGVDQKENIDVQGSLDYNQEDVPELQPLITQAMESNFDLQTLKSKREVDEAMIDLDRAEYWPQLVGFADYAFAGSSDNLDFMNYRQSMVGVSFSMNIFQGGRTQNKVQQKQIIVMQTDEQIMQLKEAIKMQLQEKLLQLEKIHTNIEAQNKNIQLAEKGYNIASVRFKEGTGTQLELLNAELQLRTARTNRLQSVYEYIVAKTELDKLLGNIDRKYIQTVNQSN